MNLSSLRPVYIFGAGYVGELYLGTICHFHRFVAFVDNDSEKQKNGYLDNNVISPDDLLAVRSENPIILVASSEKHQEEIVKQLINLGFEEGSQIKIMEEYIFDELPRMAFEEKGIIFCRVCQISLTERCSLKCKKCAHACNLVPNTRKDMSLEEAESSADNFFHFADFCQEFVLLGGEPLLYKELDKVIEYIGEKYREKMNIFSVTTNGTILPSENLLAVCKKYHVRYRISNYSKEIPRLKSQYAKLITLLNDSRVKYDISDENLEFWDYGFDYVNHGMNENELTEIFSTCKTPCREIQGNHYYYCVMAHTVAENMYDNQIGCDDFLDLSKINGNEGRKKFFDYDMGNLNKGYLDMCNHCNGSASKNILIPAGEQDEIV